MIVTDSCPMVRDINQTESNFQKEVKELKFNLDILEHQSDYTLAQAVEATKRVKALNELLASIASSIFKEEHNV